MKGCSNASTRPKRIAVCHAIVIDRAFIEPVCKKQFSLCGIVNGIITLHLINHSCTLMYSANPETREHLMATNLFYAQTSKSSLLNSNLEYIPPTYIIPSSSKGKLIMTNYYKLRL